MSIRRKERERGLLYVENIKVPEHRARGLDEGSVARLAESMARIGLQTPITVWQDEEWPTLVAGLHRLKAAERLGWDKIEVIYLEGNERDVRLWEISENLHRADLSAVERAEHIDEWRRLTETKVRQVAAPLPGGHQPKDHGHRKTAEALGISERSVRRAEAVANLPQDVREQAREERWPQERLLDMARNQEAAEARRRNREADKLIAAQRIETAILWLGGRLNTSELHQLGDMLAGVCEPLSKALLREAR